MAATVETPDDTMDAGSSTARPSVNSCSAYVTIVLDITGSMGAQIEGVRQTVQKLIPLLAENPDLGVAIVTFTEGGRSNTSGKPGCYVSVDTFSDPTKASTFVQNIVLCRPPGDQGVNAWGDDGDENAKAALYALKELDGGKATVAFFITDAGYHRWKTDSPTALAEDEYLEAKGVPDRDFYVLFDSVLDHFNGNLVVIPIVYNFQSQNENAKQAYGQIAKTSGCGVVIEPTDPNPSTLALTMRTFITRLLGQLNNHPGVQPEPPWETMAGLRLLGTSGMRRLARDIPTPPGPYPRAGRASDLFESAMTRTVTAFKMSWKRRIDVSKVSLLRQLVFGLTAAKFVLAASTGSEIAEELLQRLKYSYPEVLDAVPQKYREQIKATPKVIEGIAREVATATSVPRSVDGETDREEMVDAVTLESVRETLGAALDDEIRSSEGDEAVRAKPDVDPLKVVLANVHGVFVNVRFPPGPNGKPNFADAWSAMIDKHSFDVVSAESAMRMFKDSSEDKPSYKSREIHDGVVVGLTDRRKYNGFVPLMDEGDPLKTAVIRIFSGLQVMNLLQMTVLEGSPEGFLPNMYPGMVAATLARVIRTSAGGSWAGMESASSEANGKLASQMIFSLRGIMGAPARTARLRLKAGKADPVNPISRFLMVLSKQPRQSEEDEKAFHAKMRLVLNEWVAATVQLYFGKASLDNDGKFHSFLLYEVLPLETVFGKDALDINSLEELHPLEVAAGKGDREIPALDGWRSTGLANLSKTTLYKDVKRLVERCQVVFGCLDATYDVDDIILDYVVYRFRTARYYFIGPDDNKEGSEEGRHEPITEMSSTLTLLVKIYRNALRSYLAGIRMARRVNAMNLLKTRVASERTVTAKTRSLELLGTTYYLRRTDVPSILAMAGYGNLRFVEELVIGDWTPEPPNCLHRFSEEIIEGIARVGGARAKELSTRLYEEISKGELCLRTVGCNRHGHTADLQFPGPLGWTETYAVIRLSNLDKRTSGTDSGRAERTILQMKAFTEFGTTLLQRLQAERDDVNVILPKRGGGRSVMQVKMGQLKRDARRVLYEWNDPNCLPIIREKIKGLGVPPRLLTGLG